MGELFLSKWKIRSISLHTLVLSHLISLLRCSKDQTECVRLNYKHDVKSWALMTTSMAEADPGGQASRCLVLWRTAEEYRRSQFQCAGLVRCLWYWQLHVRNQSMQKTENYTFNLNERKWQMTFNLWSVRTKLIKTHVLHKPCSWSVDNELWQLQGLCGRV